MEEVLIPVVLFVLVFSIPIVAIISDGRTKRSRDRVLEKALEAGRTLDEVQQLFPEESDRKRLKQRPYYKGLVVLAVGGALLVARQLTMPGPGEYPATEFGEQAEGMLIGGTICLFIGIAMVVGDFLNRGSRAREQNGSQKD